MRSLFAAWILDTWFASATFLRSYRSSCGAFCFTESMPFKAPPFDVYRSLLRMVSPFPAFRTKWNCPGGEFLSTYLPAIFLLPEWMSTPAQPRAQGLAQRSEEHTSELQSLMRISYAVFCLKKKNQTINKSKDQS